MVAASIMAIVAILFSQMIQSGGRSMSYAVWYKDKLADSQRFFHTLENDIKQASQNVTIDMDEPNITDRLKTGTSPFMYQEGTEQADVENPVTGAMETAKATFFSDETSSDSSSEDSGTDIFKFNIQQPRVESGPYATPGYNVKVRCYSVGNELRYSREIVSGTIPAGDTSQRFYTGRTMLADVNYIHISHRPVLSKLTGQEIGALVYLYIFLENKDLTKGGKKGTGIKQSFKINVPATTISK